MLQSDGEGPTITDIIEHLFLACGWWSKKSTVLLHACMASFAWLGLHACAARFVCLQLSVNCIYPGPLNPSRRVMVPASAWIASLRHILCAMFCICRYAMIQHDMSDAHCRNSHASHFLLFCSTARTSTTAPTLRTWRSSTPPLTSSTLRMTRSLSLRAWVGSLLRCSQVAPLTRVLDLCLPVRFIHVCTHKHTHIHTRAHAYTHAHTCTHACTYAHRHTHTQTHTHTRAHTYTHTFAQATRSGARMWWAPPSDPPPQTLLSLNSCWPTQSEKHARTPPSLPKMHARVHACTSKSEEARVVVTTHSWAYLVSCTLHLRVH